MNLLRPLHSKDSSAELETCTGVVNRSGPLRLCLDSFRSDWMSQDGGVTEDIYAGVAPEYCSYATVLCVFV